MNTERWTAFMFIIFLVLIIMMSLWVISSKASHWEACKAICEERGMPLDGLTKTGCACSPAPGVRFYFKVGDNQTD